LAIGGAADQLWDSSSIKNHQADRSDEFHPTWLARADKLIPRNETEIMTIYNEEVLVAFRPSKAPQ
jgi:hypothetical protein